MNVLVTYGCQILSLFNRFSSVKSAVQKGYKHKTNVLFLNVLHQNMRQLASVLYNEKTTYIFYINL